MPEILSIQRLIVCDIVLLIEQVVFPFELKLVHMIVGVGFVELIVVGGIGGFEWDFVVVFGGTRDL